MYATTVLLDYTSYLHCQSAPCTTINALYTTTHYDSIRRLKRIAGKNFWRPGCLKLLKEVKGTELGIPNQEK